MTGRWASSNRKAELPRNWPAIRQRIKRRDPTCTWPGCTAPTTDVDHVGDKFDHSDRNLRGLCSPHHRERTQKQARAGRAKQAAAWKVKASRPSEPNPGLIG